MALFRVAKSGMWRVWLALLASLLFLGRRVEALVQIPPSPFASVQRDDALDASLLLLFQPPGVPVGGSNPALSSFGLRKRHMRGVILP
jgi:hypothetical protein